MGYAVRIRRQDGPITIDEWLAYASAATDLEQGAPGTRGGAEATPTFKWRDAVFEWADGQIVVDGLQDEWRKKLGQVADELGAYAFGDDGERYLSDGRVDYGDGPESVQGVRTLAAFKYEPPVRARPKSNNKAIAAAVVAVIVLVVVVAFALR